MTKIIVNSRIYLDLIQDQDLERLVELVDYPYMHQQLWDMFPYPYTMDDAQWRIDHIYEELKIDDGKRHRAIYIDEQYAGDIWFEIVEWWRKAHNYQLSYRLWEPYRGKWYMTQIVNMFCEYMWGVYPDCHRICWLVFAYNPASRRVLEKCGFQLEGTLREAICRDGERYDERVLGKVRGE